MTMTPFTHRNCAVCGGVVYLEAHFIAKEGDTIAYLGSNQCVIALARCMQEMGLSLSDAISVKK